MLEIVDDTAAVIQYPVEPELVILVCFAQRAVTVREEVRELEEALVRRELVKLRKVGYIHAHVILRSHDLSDEL